MPALRDSVPGLASAQNRYVVAMPDAEPDPLQAPPGVWLTIWTIALSVVPLLLLAGF